ncbi:MAG: 30S ribosome-binding factor RbfA [Bacillota bacterium]|nr:30S ribosome-binding factor RbfA [Bacillota bacterium]
MAKHRSGRINEEFKREISEIIRDLKDPRIPMMTSVINVEVTPDLKYAKVYTSVMGTEEEGKEAVKALTSAAGFIRREIGARMSIRAIPEITFQLDSSIAYGAHISKILKDINEGSNE